MLPSSRSAPKAELTKAAADASAREGKLSLQCKGS
jgi:hypothetical protein